MEHEELYDDSDNLRLSEQELPLEDFGDCKLKSNPYVGMQFDSLDGVETFYKEFSKKEGFGIRICTSKKAPRIDNVTSRIMYVVVKGNAKQKIHLIVERVEMKKKKARRSCSSLRTRCAAMLRVMKNKKLQKWVVKGFDNNHNHCIISPKSVSYLQCQKKKCLLLLRVLLRNLVKKVF